MQTAAIPYRVADFLKQHPPFQYMDEPDLLVLAARGRVKFHEPDEYLCWQGSPHTPFVFVIQQGSVALWDEKSNPPVLQDIRGVGDMIGIERFQGSATSLYSAKSTSEVVVYALQAAALEPLIEEYPLAAQYIAGSASTAAYEAPGARKDPHEVFLADLVRDRAPAQCVSSTSVKDAAAILIDTDAPALAVTDDGAVTAILTPTDFLRAIVAGSFDPTQPVQTLVRGTPVTLTPGASVTDSLLAMAERGTMTAGLTSDGSPQGSLQSVVTAASLSPAFGDHPIHILQEISSARRVEALRAAHERARAWILEYLAAPAVIDWLTAFSDLVNRRILERLLALIAEDRPDVLWCFYGAAGRGERLTSVAPRLAVIGSAPVSLENALAECGFLLPEPPVSATLEEWKTRFSGWIRDPILTQSYLAYPFFDMRPVRGPVKLFDELKTHVAAELADAPAFLQVLANDCLSTLPPLTFFRDLVVEESGERTDTFHLESSALQPLADVARVFGLASGAALGGSTRERFERARRLLPAEESVFREAAETMRAVLFFQARAGLRRRSSGADLPLSLLSRYDRQVLKNAFRSIHRLLEFTADGDWMEAR